MARVRIWIGDHTSGDSVIEKVDKFYQENSFVHSTKAVFSSSKTRAKILSQQQQRFHTLNATPNSALRESCSKVLVSKKFLFGQE